MKIHGKQVSLLQTFCLIVYYSIGRYLPESHKFYNLGGCVRYHLCKHIFKKCGKYVNIERGAWFGTGVNVEIGDYSGIGINAHIPSDTIIGKYVMMGPNCFILDNNHRFDDTEKPMRFQGHVTRSRTIIEDDVWIGRCVSMTPGRHISKGSIIAMNCVLSKNFPPYSIIGGNPSRIIRMRK